MTGRERLPLIITDAGPGYRPEAIAEPASRFGDLILAIRGLNVEMACAAASHKRLIDRLLEIQRREDERLAMLRARQVTAAAVAALLALGFAVVWFGRVS